VFGLGLIASCDSFLHPTLALSFVREGKKKKTLFSGDFIVYLKLKRVFAAEMLLKALNMELLIQSCSSNLACYRAINKSYLLFFDQPLFCCELRVLTNYVTREKFKTLMK